MKDHIIMCKKIFTIFVFIGIIFSQSPDELYNAANISLEAGNVSEAEAGFKAALEADLTFAPAYMGLAQVAIRKGDLDKTQQYIKEAIDADPENQEFRHEFDRMNELYTLMNQGKRSMGNSEVDDAMESFRIAHKKFPTYSESVYSMGVVMARQKKYDEALDYFRQTAEINKESEKASVAMNNIGRIYLKNGLQLYKRGDLDGAMEQFEKSISADESIFSSLYQIGMIQSKMGNQDDAIKSYQKVLSINSKHYKSYLALALAKKRLNDLDGALLALESATDINPGYDKAYGVMGEIYIERNDFKKAKEILNTAVTVNKDYQRGYANLGKIYLEEENWDQAISSLENAVSLNGRDHNSFFRLANAHNTKGDCAAAKDAARKSTELKNNFGGAWYELGVAEWCKGKGNKTAALRAFERARNDRSWRDTAEHEIDKIKYPQKYEN